MTELVRFEKQGKVGFIIVDNPPVNALSPGVPEGIRRGLEQWNEDSDVQVIVLMGAGRSFIAGADIKHLGKRKMEGKRNQDLLEENAKPVVAAIHGFALGGGLEVSLGCHYRVAVASAKVGLPEVLIGVLPGGGGTQRLPRLIGVEKALDLIVTGRHVPASEAVELGILDAVIDGADLKASARAFAEGVIGHPMRQIGQLKAQLDADDDPFAAMQKKIARRARNQQAPYHCIEAVRASVELPFSEGLQRERVLFEELVNADEAKSLRYAFFAERKVRDVPGVDKTAKGQPVHAAAVIGGGTMGSGIAMTLADAGIPVKLLEVSEEAVNKAMEKIRHTYGVSVKRGSVSETVVAERIARITPVTEYDAIGDADIVLEAVFEEMNIKVSIFEKLDATMKPGAILASNTSALDIDRIAAATRRPESVIGTHFFSPANVMKLLEIVRGEKTSPEVISTTMALAKTIGKVGVVCGNCDGFTANRSRIPFNVEMNVLIEEGASPEQVDRVMVDFGYPMGPFAVADLAGGDISYAGRQRRQKENPDTRKLPIADRLVENGRLGQKTQAGWFRYVAGDRTPEVDPEVNRIIDEVRREIGVNVRDIPDEEVLQRILFRLSTRPAKSSKRVSLPAPATLTPCGSTASVSHAIAVV